MLSNVIMQRKSFGLLAGRKKMALGFFTSDAYESKGGDTMTDFEIIYLVILVATLVLAAVDFGRNSNNRNK